MKQLLGKRFPKGWGWALLALASASSCHSKEPVGGTLSVSPSVTAAAGEPAAQGPTARAPAAQPSNAHGEDEHAANPIPAGALAMRLTPEAAERVTTLRVFAHASSVIIRKEDGQWVTGGARGCIVAPARIQRALDSLTNLTAVRSAEPAPPGNAFGLQIAVLMGEELALRFDIADRTEEGDLVRLGDNSTARVRGLDHELWSADPATWCAGR
jgi:hypothetical protein